MITVQILLTIPTPSSYLFFFFNDTATTEIYTLSLHDALPIYNEHNSWIPRDFWLEDWEKRAILDFHARYPLEGYRRLTFMMLDADVVAVSPTSVWRVLHWAGRLSRWKDRPSGKGKGFEQPLGPHQHWHGAVA